MSALDGVRVLDVGHLTSGPLASWLLGSLGADVVKIEPPSGDGGRTNVSPAEEAGPEGGYYFHSRNTDKRSVVLDVRSDRGRETMLDLAAETDVLVENYRPGTMAEQGLGYETLGERNPGLIYSSITGYGEDNVAAGARAYDSILQAQTGIMTATGYRDDPPTKVGVSLIDNLASYVAAAAVVGALVYRQRTGRGQFVDVSMQDCTAWLVQSLLPFDADRTDHQPASDPFPLVGVFETRDDWLLVSATDEGAAAGLRELLAATGSPADGDGTAALEAAVERWAADRPTDAAVDACDRHGVSAVRVAGVGDVVSNPGLARAFADVDCHGQQHTVPVSPYASALPGQDRPAGGGPALGEHTEEVLAELAGYDEDEIAALAAAGTITTSD